MARLTDITKYCLGSLLWSVLGNRRYRGFTVDYLCAGNEGEEVGEISV